MTLKKALVAITVVAMLFGMVSTAFAGAATVNTAAFSDVKATDASFKAVSSLYAQGIAKGYANGTFNPAGTLTRSEFVTFVVRMLGLEATATASASYTPAFVDGATVGDWAKGYVNVAQALGLVKGDPAGKFNPNANVTYAEASAILIRAVGRDFEVPATGWPMNYLVKASTLGITANIVPVAGASVTRGDMAIMVVNTQGVTRYAADQKNTLGAFVTPVTGNVGDFTAGSTTVQDSVYLTGVGDFKLANNVVIVGASTVAALKFMDIKAVKNADDQLIYIEAAKPTAVAAGAFDKVADYSTTDTAKSIFLADGSKFKFATSFEVYLNGTKQADETALASGDSVKLTQFNGAVTRVDATRVNVTDEQIASVTNTTDTKKVTVSGTIYYNVTANTVITLNGAAATLADLKANYVVDITSKGASTATATDALAIAASSTYVQGTVTGTRTATASSTSYYATVKAADGTSKEVKLNHANIATPSIGDYVKYALNNSGVATYVLSVSGGSNIVKIVSVATASDSTGTVNTVIVDKAGQSVTYTVYGATDFVSHIGEVGTITTDGPTGKANGFTAIVIDGSSPVGTIYSVDATNGVLVIKAADGTLVVTNASFASYTEDATTAFKATSFKAISSYAVGDEVLYNTITVSGTVSANYVMFAVKSHS